ncbi:hypothetical protein L6452_34447 [Arctium lappa]|uniref:Uncharacterized protein n=1 Tax=Arctium lappa TaxID=4217 RepID=A0ACB8YMH4_ARCLA|nr:hypothetical protein L6452_34447 [Arctium lappa]
MARTKQVARRRTNPHSRIDENPEIQTTPVQSHVQASSIQNPVETPSVPETNEIEAMKAPSVQYRRRSNRHKGMKKGDPAIEVSVSPKDSNKRTKVVASSEETTATSPSKIVAP